MGPWFFFAVSHVSSDNFKSRSIIFRKRKHFLARTGEIFVSGQYTWAVGAVIE
jgi:hypothetical protein